MRALLGGPEGGEGYAKSKTFCQKSQRSQIKVKLAYVKEVKNFSLGSQRVSLVSSNRHKSKKVKTPLQTSIIVTCREHDWSVFVTKFLRGLQNFLKIGSSCDLRF